MSQEPRTHFTSLNEAEKKSKLWQLASQKGKCTLWRRGQKERSSFRTIEFKRDENRLLLHEEPGAPSVGQDVLGTFELNGVGYFFKAKITPAGIDEVGVDTTGEFFKSERRQNFRLLTYPIYDISAVFKLPAHYDGGKVVDIKNRSSQTGLFKSFLKLVDPHKEEKIGETLKLRLQDLSVTGMSVHIGAAELDWFRAGELSENVEIQISGETIAIPKCRLVYVVDHIGHSDRHHKKYKVGIRFEELPTDIDHLLGAKINELLRSVDANKEFEDFIK